MKRAEANDRERERLVSPPWSQREREEMERAVAREVKGVNPLNPHKVRAPALKPTCRCVLSMCAVFCLLYLGPVFGP
jgi:hypothetical protein